MKSFSNLAVCHYSPNVALGILDGLRIKLDPKEAALQPSFGDIIEMSEEAGSLLELATTARALQCSDVRVLRVPSPQVPWGPIQEGFFRILDEYGHYIVCLADPSSDEDGDIPELDQQLVISVNSVLVPAGTVPQLVAYMVAARELGLPSDYNPQVVDLSSSAVSLEPFDSEEQVLRFARTAARDCPSYAALGGFAHQLCGWLRDQVGRGVKDAQLHEALLSEDPFSQWRQQPAELGAAGLAQC